MKIKLPSGKLALVFVRHDYDTKRRRRVTVASAIIDGNVFTALATCSRADNFVKREGRKLAMRRLNDIMREAEIERPDRRAICQRIFK